MEHNVNIHFKKYYLIALLCFFTFSIRAAHIIFDLGNVLIETHIARALWQIGPLKLLYYTSGWRNPFALRKHMYDFLNTLEENTSQEVIAKDEYGLILPPLVCAWLKGEVTGAEILNRISTALSSSCKYSTTAAEQILIKAIADLMFIPSLFMSTRTMIQPGIDFVKECKRNGHTLYIISNWDADSFKLLEALHHSFFNMFEGIMISGEVGLLKPDPKIYELFLDIYNLNPEECIFIDDQYDNVVAAEQLGIKSIQYKKQKKYGRLIHNFDEIRKKIAGFTK